MLSNEQYNLMHIDGSFKKNEEKEKLSFRR